MPRISTSQSSLFTDEIRVTDSQSCRGRGRIGSNIYSVSDILYPQLDNTYFILVESNKISCFHLRNLHFYEGNLKFYSLHMLQGFMPRTPTYTPNTHKITLKKMLSFPSYHVAALCQSVLGWWVAKATRGTHVTPTYVGCCEKHYVRRSLRGQGSPLFKSVAAPRRPDQQASRPQET